jgi:hypothetical protein
MYLLLSTPTYYHNYHYTLTTRGNNTRNVRRAYEVKEVSVLICTGEVILTGNGPFQAWTGRMALFRES